MLVKELKNMLESMNDEDELKVTAPNAPPWITNFIIQKVEVKDDVAE